MFFGDKFVEVNLDEFGISGYAFSALAGIRFFLELRNSFKNTSAGKKTPDTKELLCQIDARGVAINPTTHAVEKKSMKYYLLRERPGQQTQSTSATHNFTLLLGQQVSPSVLSFLLDFRNLRLPTTCERWGPLWTTEAICSRVLHRKGDLHVFFSAPAKIWVIQKSTLNIYFSADPWSKIKCSWRIIHSVETRGRSCQTFHKCVEGRMCAAEAIFENNPSWKLSKSQLNFLSLLILVLLRQQKIWRFPKILKISKEIYKENKWSCKPVPSYFKASKAASQSPPQTTKVPEKGEHWCRIEMDGHV